MALRRARELGAAAVIDELKASRLLGRGGAAFPTGVKWEAVAGQPAQPALRRLQRRRVRAGNVQGPRADGERPVRARGGDHDRGVRDRRHEGVHLRPGRVSARTRADRERDRAEPRLTSSGRRDRAADRRRRLRLRRGDGALPVDRGLSRRAAQQAAVPGRGRPVRQADGRQQRRDALQRARGAARRRCRIRADRHRGLERHAALLRLRLRRPARALRAAVRRDATRAARPGRRCSRRRPCCSAARRAHSSGRSCSISS